MIARMEREVSGVIGSVLIYLSTFISCLILQRISKRLLPESLYVFAADFFITLAVCGYRYGHATVRQLHGHVGYLVAAVPLTTLTLLSLEGCASPLGVFTKLLKGEETIQKFILRVIIQTIAAFLSFRLVLLICTLEITSQHQQLLHRTTCETHLKVPVLTGFLIEFCGVLYDAWVGQHRLLKNHVLDLGVKVLNSCLLVCGGVHLTGMYMHPAMASGITWACQGTSPLEHLLVYWCGPFLGCYCGLALKSVFQLPGAFQESVANVTQTKKTTRQQGGQRTRSPSNRSNKRHK